MEQTRYDIFISYSRKDAKIVDSVVSNLEKQGFRIWLDKDGVESGDAFKSVIVKAIEDSACVLFFSSINSNLSKWTAKEIGVAVYENKYIIPIRLDKSKYNPEIKFDLINLDYIDFTDNAIRSEMIAKLIKALSIKCGKTVESGVVEANTYPARQNVFSKSYWSAYLDNLKKRNPLVSFVLLALQIAAILYFIPGLSGTLWSFSLLDNPEWNFMSIYGKGYIPGFLICCSVFITNGMVLKLNKNGIYLLFISIFITIIPTIWNEFEEFICFSAFSILGVLIYLGLLFVPHKGLSLWKQFKANTPSFKPIAIAAISMWIILLTLFPLLMSNSTGFSHTSYTNGMCAINARCNGGAYYVRSLANRLAYEDEGAEYTSELSDRYISYTKASNAEAWYKKAIYISENRYDVRDWEIMDCYIDYIYFLATNKKRSEALEYLKKAVAMYGMTEIEKEIHNSSRDYDRNVSRSTVLSYLSEIVE